MAGKTINAQKPLYSTLVFLDFRYNKFSSSSSSGPVADFSCFVRLKTLIVHAGLCFESLSSDRPDERCGFYKGIAIYPKKLKASILRLMGYQLG